MDGFCLRNYLFHHFHHFFIGENVDFITKIHVTKSCVCQSQWYSLIKLKVFSKATTPLVCLPCNVTHSKQAALMFSFLPFQFNLFYEVRKFLDLFLYLPLVYINPLFPINKQFSIDSFLDWEGHHWDSRSTRSSHHPHKFSLSRLVFSSLWR